jgi:hypothetical protein
MGTTTLVDRTPGGSIVAIDGRRESNSGALVKLFDKQAKERSVTLSAQCGHCRSEAPDHLQSDASSVAEDACLN